ncbi:hypothetical protein [Thalassobacillus hwangdonensis]|uniref:Lipoprotein n=1 Tax=Thalassobacillus hwangdonensis TaxID=546108 RepID=A0ABW3L2B9_9BACI
MRFRSFIVSILLLFTLSACNSPEEVQGKQGNSSKESKESVLYENTSYHLSVGEMEGWLLEKETDEGRLHAKFTNNQSKAIVTVTETTKSFENIKDELKDGAGKVDVVQDDKASISFISGLNEKMRTDIYIKKHREFTYVFTFISPLSAYEKKENEIKKFLDEVHLK